MSRKAGFLKRVMNALIEARERDAQRGTQQFLLGLSDGFLKEMGISRELLRQGPVAWPWRVEQAPRNHLGASGAMGAVSVGSYAHAVTDDRAGHEAARAANRLNSGDKLAA